MVVYGPFRRLRWGRRRDKGANGWRRRWESNPCTGLCRPLPEPLGHVAVSGHVAVTRTRPETIPDDRLGLREVLLRDDTTTQSGLQCTSIDGVSRPSLS